MVEGNWQVTSSMNTLVRDEGGQELALDIEERLTRFGSVGRLRSIAAGLQDSITLGSPTSLTQAVGPAWTYRDIDTDEVERSRTRSRSRTCRCPDQLTNPARGTAHMVAR